MLNNTIIASLQKYFSSQPVKKVWLFGSYSRGEETPSSDVDLLVSFDPSAGVTLFTMGGMYMDLCNLLGKKVDLIEEGTLEDYAKKTAYNDRTLIYERTV